MPTYYEYPGAQPRNALQMKRMIRNDQAIQQLPATDAPVQLPNYIYYTTLIADSSNTNASWHLGLNPSTLMESPEVLLWPSHLTKNNCTTANRSYTTRDTLRKASTAAQRISKSMSWQMGQAYGHHFWRFEKWWKMRWSWVPVLVTMWMYDDQNVVLQSSIDEQHKITHWTALWTALWRLSLCGWTC